MTKALPHLLALLLLATGARAGAVEAAQIPAAGVALLLHVTAKPPAPGQWIEYRLAFPVDPLENSLRPDPLPQPHVGAGGIPPGGAVEVDGEFYIRPSFEPATAWQVLPLRLEIQTVDSLGFTAVLLFEDGRQPLHFPIETGDARGEFHYDADREQNRAVTVRLDNGEYQALATVRRAGEYGYARIAGDDAPFGLFRFANENVDLVLVGMGTGTPPPFPLNPTEPVTPPPGLFYQQQTETPPERLNLPGGQ